MHTHYGAVATLAMAALAMGSSGPARGAEQPCNELGIFESHTDIGDIALPGSVSFDCERNEYRVSGSGRNIWDSEDAFHFVWRRLTGDATLEANVRFLGQGQHQYRKAGWMLRESLDADAAYVDAVVHGDGMISLQYRKEKGEGTREIRAGLRAPADVRLEREGDEFTLYVGRTGLPLERRARVRVSLPETVYAGLVVCSHDSDTSETAILSHVAIERPD
jgi:hypothetical protein